MFQSTFRKLWNHTPMKFPEFSGTRIMMMPVVLGSLRGVPTHYHDFISQLMTMVESRFIGQIGYLTIDERVVEAGKSLRRGGLHVDGYYQGRCGAWGGGGGWLARREWASRRRTHGVWGTIPTDDRCPAQAHHRSYGGRGVHF